MFIKRKDNSWNTSLILSVILLTLILGIILNYYSNGIIGNDFWWHVKVGEWIVKNREIPTHDIFSWIGKEYSISWTAHEWLSDVIFYFIFSNCGQTGIFVLSLILSILTIFLMFNTVKKYFMKNVLISSFFFICCAILLHGFFYGRPHMFSFLLLFIELRILYAFEENTESKGIHFLPLIACLWSNLHGGSSNLSYILCLIFLIASLLNFEYKRLYSERKSKKAIIKLAVITVLTIAGVFANPIGVKVFIYPYTNLADPIQMNVISEWGAPDMKNISELLLYFLPIALMTVGIIIGNDKLKLLDMIIMGSFIFLFLRSVRFIMMWYIAAVFYAFKYMPQCKFKQITRRYELVISALLIVVMFIPIGFGVYKIDTLLKSDKIVSTTVSDEMIETIKEEKPKRIFNGYNLGGELIYNEIDVFYDSRADLYAAEHIMEDGISLEFLTKIGDSKNNIYVDVDSLINKYDFDGFLVEKDKSLYAYIMSQPERFKLIYEDDSSGYFKIIK